MKPEIIKSKDTLVIQKDLPVFELLLRDYFAGQAMQGLAADSQYNPSSLMEMAELAYHWADAMLAERNK